MIRFRLITLALLMTAVAGAAVANLPAPAAPRPTYAVAEVAVPEVLKGDTWLRHLEEDLLPYWDLPQALGEPVGNFPSFRGRNGELLPDQTDRGVFTLARGVYGYSLAYHLTGKPKFLTYARAGLDWIEAHGRDPVFGGYFGELNATGSPVNSQGNKDLFDLATMGLAYGMYFNVTRDPAAEAELLAIRDLIFDKYYDAATGRFRDSLTYDLTTEIDTGGNGGDIVNLLVPGTAVLLPGMAILTDPGRRAQFAGDLRVVTNNLIARHKNNAAVNPANRWMFWGRTARRGQFLAAQTDFGHTIKSYEMIYNSDRRYAAQPWAGLAADRTTMLGKAWDEAASRWNFRPLNFIGAAEPDSSWWMHDEADQTLAALDLDDGFSHAEQLARSAQTWLDVFVDRDPAYPARETFARVARDPANTNLTKSAFGKNMLHNFEHALIMYLHGRAMEGQPARVHYAFPAADALTAAAKPYWFDSARQFREVGAPLVELPGHVAVTVDFSEITGNRIPPTPSGDVGAPVTVSTLSSEANEEGWHHEDVRLSLATSDDLTGVREIQVSVVETRGAAPARGWLEPGADFSLSLPEGEYDVAFRGIDLAGNAEQTRSLHLRIDTTSPTLTGLAQQPCRLWPPTGKLVHVADVAAADAWSGLLAFTVEATSSEEAAEGDIVTVGGSVDLRAIRDDEGPGRTYTITSSAEDLAGNTTTSVQTCLVPHDLRR